MFPCWPSTKIVQVIMIRQKTWLPGGWAYFPYISIYKSLKIFLSETNEPISISLGRNVSLVTLYQDCSSHHDLSKNMAARGWGIFSLYIHIENFKNLLLRNRWIVHTLMIRQKIWGRDLFFVYICIENFKILLVRNHLTDFNITWQECCIGDPLPRLFKQSWFIKKHGC